MNKSLTVVSLVSLLVSGYALAAGPATSSPAQLGAHTGSPYHASFVKLDANKDGYLERQEAKANVQLERDFNKVAKNGRLTEAEFAAWEMHQTPMTSGKQEQMREHMQTPASHKIPTTGGSAPASGYGK